MENEYSLLVGKTALGHLQETSDWYEAKRRGLGNSFLMEFSAAAELLRTYPKLKQVVRKHFRRALMKRFPYAIFYSVDDSRKTVLVVAVLHTGTGEERIEKELPLP